MFGLLTTSDVVEALKTGKKNKNWSFQLLPATVGLDSHALRIQMQNSIDVAEFKSWNIDTKLSHRQGLIACASTKVLWVEIWSYK